MATQHLNLYDWGTSNPIEENLKSSYSHPERSHSSIISGLKPSTSVSGDPDEKANDRRVLTKIKCGKGSYLEKVSHFCLTQ